MMERVKSDIEVDLHVSAYHEVAEVIGEDWRIHYAEVSKLDKSLNQQVLFFLRINSACLARDKLSTVEHQKLFV